MKTEADRARAALAVIPANLPRDEWHEVGRAAIAAGLTLDDVDNWSESAENYKGRRDIEAAFRTVKPNGGTGAGTLFHHAKQYGFNGANDNRSSIPIAKPSPSPAKPVKQAANGNAAQVWSRCIPATPAEPYIYRKQGKPDGLRVYPASAAPLVIRVQNVAGYLVVPCWSGGDLQTLQFIPPDGGDKLRLFSQIMLLSRPTKRHSEPLSGFRAVAMFAVEGAKPAQVVGQVAGCYAAKLVDPTFEAAMIRIDVLHVPSAVNSNAGRQVDGMMLDTQLSRCAGQCVAAVGAKHHILRQERLQRCGKSRHIHSLQYTIHRHPGTIPGDQHRHLFVRKSPLGGFAAALTRFSIETASFALEGQQEHRLVGFGNTGQRLRLERHGQRQETMPPAVRRADVDVQRVRHFVQRQPLTQRFGLAQPLAPLMQAAQRRAGQGAKRLATIPTTIALQPIGVAVPVHALGFAMWTRRHGGEASFDNQRRNRLRVQRRQFCRHNPALHWRQLSQRRCDSIQLRLPHFSLLDDSALLRHNVQYPLRVAHHVSHQHDLRKEPKLNLPGASFNDGFFTVGEITDRVYVCEGIGQAWAVNKATGAAAVVCFGAGRMMAVGKVLRAKYPAARLIVVSDKGKESQAATIAAAVSGQWIAMPTDKPSNYDANDYAAEQGSGALAALLERPQAPSMRFKLLSGADLCNAEPMRWMVRGVLPVEGLAALFGASGSGKSFLMLDIGCAVAGGDYEWFGRRVTQCPVTYVCLEGEAGMGKRVKAWRLHHKQPVPDALQFITQPFDLLSDDVPELAKSVIAGGGAGGLVILDTLNRAAPGADENSSVDMGNLIAAAKQLQNLTGGMVLLVHHTGKDATKGLRGHSSLYAALDGAIEVIATDNRKAWSVAKSKDDVTGDAHPFKLEIITVGIDDEGEEITSCVAVPDESGEGIKARRTTLGANQKIAFDVLGEPLRKSPHIGKEGAPVGRPCLDYTEAVEIVAERMPTDAKHRKSRAISAIGGLVTKGYMGMKGDWLWCN